jgi:hypothetical protein
MKSDMTKHEHQIQALRDSISKGIEKSKSIIIKTSANCAKSVQDSPVGGLAVNVDDTIKVFVTDNSDNSLLRFDTLAHPLINIVVDERSKTFSNVDSHKKVTRLGTAFGLMIGTTALTSVIKIFVNQAATRLEENKEITADEKRTCFSYINDVFSVILMTLNAALENDFRISKREKAFFAELLWKNDWKSIFNNRPIEPNAELPVSEPEKQGELEEEK